MTENKDTAINNLIMKFQAGSEVHGLSLSTSDLDEFGIAIPPPHRTFGFQPFEHYVQRDQPDGVRSQPGDLDLTIFSLRKWLLLALKGNPNTLTPLFVDPSNLIVYTSYWRRWVATRDLILSKKAGHAFLGYLTAQKKQLMTSYTRPALVDEFGYDTKAAAHAIRLGIQGTELLRSGHISLPMSRTNRDLLIGIRTGQVDFSRILTLIDYNIDNLQHGLSESFLPDEPNYDACERMMIEDYFDHWADGTSRANLSDLLSLG